MTTPAVEVDPTTAEALYDLADVIDKCLAEAFSVAFETGLPDFAISQLLRKASSFEVLSILDPASRSVVLREFAARVAMDVVALRKRDAMIALEVPERSTP